VDLATGATPTLDASVAPKALRDRHAHWGLWLLLGLLFLSASGLTWSRFAGDNISVLRQAWGWGTPTLKTALPNSGVQADSHDHSDHQRVNAPTAVVATHGFESPTAHREAETAKAHRG